MSGTDPAFDDGAVMTTTANLGLPRMGVARELKWALERAWRDDCYEDLRTTAATLRARHWMLQRDRDIERIPVGDLPPRPWGWCPSVSVEDPSIRRATTRTCGDTS